MDGLDRKSIQGHREFREATCDSLNKSGPTHSDITKDWCEKKIALAGRSSEQIKLHSGNGEMI